jgi:hypothetical protein
MVENPQWITKPHTVASLSKQHPTLIAQYLMYLVLGLQQMPLESEAGLLTLPEPTAQEYMDKVVYTVADLVTADDEFVGTMEGLRCLILQGKYFLNMGRARRAWLAFRRSIAIAQLMGIHRYTPSASFFTSPTEQDAINHKKAMLWSHIFISDRFTSLMLGTSYGIPDDQCDVHFIVPESISIFEEYPYKLSIAAGMIIDRNQSSKTTDYSLTQKIDQYIIELAKSAPSDFWDVAQAEDITSDNEAYYYGKMMLQITHCVLVMGLHMPFMALPDTQTEYDYSKSTCLSMARKVLQTFTIMSTICRKSYPTCRAADFNGFIAALVLLVNCLKLSIPNGIQKGNPSLLPAAGDIKLVEDFIETLETAPSATSNNVTTQVLHVLRTLKDVQSRRGGYGDESIQLPIPYFGIITVSSDCRPGTEEYSDSVMASGSSEGDEHTPTATPSTSVSQSSGDGSVPLSVAEDMSDEPAKESPAANPFMNLQDQLNWTQNLPSFPDDGLVSLGGPYESVPAEFWNINFNVDSMIDLNDDWSGILNAPDAQGRLGFGNGSEL